MVPLAVWEASAVTTHANPRKEALSHHFINLQNALMKTSRCLSGAGTSTVLWVGQGDVRCMKAESDQRSRPHSAEDLLTLWRCFWWMRIWGEKKQVGITTGIQQYSKQSGTPFRYVETLFLRPILWGPWKMLSSQWATGNYSHWENCWISWTWAGKHEWIKMYQLVTWKPDINLCMGKSLKCRTECYGDETLGGGESKKKKATLSF